VYSSVEQIQDGRGWGNLSGLAFGIDGCLVLDDLEISGLSRSQRDRAVESALEFFRQTGGSGVVISHGAVKDFNIHGGPP
jgi:hypothetical protein